MPWKWKPVKKEKSISLNTEKKKTLITQATTPQNTYLITSRFLEKRTWKEKEKVLVKNLHECTEKLHTYPTYLSYIPEKRKITYLPIPTYDYL